MIAAKSPVAVAEIGARYNCSVSSCGIIVSGNTRVETL